MESYEKIKVLGEGSYGTVYLMRHKEERRLYCMKVIKIRNIPKKELDACRTEVELMKRLHHPNLVSYKDSFLTSRKDALCIAMEYCDGGDLCAVIQAAKKKLFPESKILNYFVQMALGLHYMHGHHVLHRDLKTQNVFLLGNGRLVLGDLGISKVMDGTDDFARTCIGTPYYMSPEIFKIQSYNHKSDIWALGCILYELTTLNHAFDARSLNGLALKIIKGRYPPIHSRYSPNLRDLIQRMLSTNPEARPTLRDILTYPFIRRHIVNFISDISSREQQSIGEGTMILKAAAVNMVNPSSVSVDLDPRAEGEMSSLRTQMDDLGLQAMISQAIRCQVEEEDVPPSDPQAAIRAAKYQASALRREEDRKQAVESALSRLRRERAERSSQRNRSSSSQAKRSGNSSRGNRIDSPMSFRSGKKEKGSIIGNNNAVGVLGGGKSPTDVPADGGHRNKRWRMSVLNLMNASSHNSLSWKSGSKRSTPIPVVSSQRSGNASRRVPSPSPNRQQPALHHSPEFPNALLPSPPPSQRQGGSSSSERRKKLFDIQQLKKDKEELDRLMKKKMGGKASPTHPKENQQQTESLVVNPIFMPPHPPSNGKLDKSKGVDQVTVKKGSCRKEEVPCSTEDKSGGAVSAEVITTEARNNGKLPSDRDENVTFIDDEGDQDIHIREEELEEELRKATLRCNNLRNHLQRNKGMIPVSVAESKRNKKYLEQNASGGEKYNEESIESDSSTTATEETLEKDTYISTFKALQASLAANFEQNHSHRELLSRAKGGSPENPPPTTKMPSRPPRPNRNNSKGHLSPGRDHRSKEGDERFNQATPPVQGGRLADRIQILRKRCIEGLGETRFSLAYSLLKENETEGCNLYPPYLSSQCYQDGGEANDASQEEVWKQLESILGENNLHYQPLIDQLLFVENSLGA